MTLPSPPPSQVWYLLDDKYWMQSAAREHAWRLMAQGKSARWIYDGKDWRVEVWTNIVTTKSGSTTG